MPGKKYASIKNPRQYEKLRSLGFSKEQAARISNSRRKAKRRTREAFWREPPTLEEHNVVPHGPGHGGRKAAARAAAAAVAARGPGRTTRIRRGLRGEGVDPIKARMAAPGIAAGQRQLGLRGRTEGLIKAQAAAIKQRNMDPAEAQRAKWREQGKRWRDKKKQGDQKPWDKQGTEAEAELLGGKITNIRSLRSAGMRGGISETFVGEINGKRVFIKPVSGQPGRVHGDIPGGEDHKRERAAYVTTKLMGGYIEAPATVIRTDSPKGVAVVMADAKGMRGNTSMQMTVFDGVIGNFDRHGGNYIPAAGGRYVPIDHGLAFPQGRASRNVWNGDFLRGGGQNLDGAARTALTTLRTSNQSELTSLVGASAVNDMNQRVDFMLTTGRTLTLKEINAYAYRP